MKSKYSFLKGIVITSGCSIITSVFLTALNLEPARAVFCRLWENSCELDVSSITSPSTPSPANRRPQQSVSQNNSIRGRVIQIYYCTEQSGVLADHDLAVVRVYNDRTNRAPSTYVVYSTYPGHGLNRPGFLRMVRQSMDNGWELDFYPSEQKGSGVCGVTSPDRYHFLRDMRYAQ